MNRIRQTALTSIVKLFPNLFSLDLAFNDLCDLGTASTWIMQLEKLKMLSLEGNPMTLIPFYREVFTERMPNLKVVDGLPVVVN
jgi:Leucine-rich repeat (LRR) protein